MKWFKIISIVIVAFFIIRIAIAISECSTEREFEQAAAARVKVEGEAQKRLKVEKAADLERLPKLLASIEQAIAESRWEDAAKIHAEASRIKPDAPGLSESNAKIIPEIAKINAQRDAEARAKLLADAIASTEAVVNDEIKCGTPTTVSEAWKKLKEFRKADPEFTRAKKLAARLDRCRVQIERALDVGVRTFMIAQRKSIEEKLDQVFLDSNLDVNVRVHGDNAALVTLTHVFFGNRATIYNLTKSGDLLEMLKNVGFKRVTFADGFGKATYYELEPEPEKGQGQRKLAESGIGERLELEK